MRDFRIFRTVQHIGIHMSIVFQRNKEYTVCKVQSRRILQESRSFIKC